MTRPRKNIVDYFPHIATPGKTTFILEQKFKNDGYAALFKMFEILARTENHYLDCSNEENWIFLVARFGVDEDRAVNILDTMARLELIDKEIWEKNRGIWCQNFVNGVSDVYKKRSTKLPDVNSFRSGNPSFRSGNPQSVGVSGSENPQSKVKESKVKKRRVYTPPEKSGGVRKKTLKKFDKNSEERKLTILLMQKILKNNPDHSFSHLPEKQLEEKVQSWADHVRLMIDRDGRTPDQIRFIIDWCQSDSFWKCNILSTEKLRKQFDQLVIKANPKNQNNFIA